MHAQRQLTTFAGGSHAFVWDRAEDELATARQKSSVHEPISGPTGLKPELRNYVGLAGFYSPNLNQVGAINEVQETELEIGA